MSVETSDFDPFDPRTPDEAAELRALCNLLELSEVFSLVFARCNVAPLRDRLIERVRAELPGFSIEHFHFDRPITNLLYELRDRLSAPLPDAVFVSGLEHSLTDKNRVLAAPVVSSLNIARDLFPKYVPRPLVLWVTGEMLTAIFHGAPDFFSVRSGVFLFAASPENSREIADQLTRETVQQIGNLARADKEDRVVAIRRLLADYATLTPADRDLREETNLLIQLGHLLDVRGDAAGARGSYERALDLARQTGDRYLEGVALGNLGLAYTSLGEVRRAIENYEQSLAISRKIGSRGGEGAHLGNLGNAYADLGEVRRAIENYEQSLAISREIGDRRGEGNQLGNLGLAYADLGEVRRAIEYYEQALAIAREVEDRRREHSNLARLGNAYAKLGEWLAAIVHHEQALAVARDLGNLREQCSQLEAISDARGALDDPKQAVEYYELALIVEGEFKDPKIEGRLRWKSAQAWAKAGDRDWAIGQGEKALAVLEPVDPEEAAAIRDALAEWRKTTDAQHAAAND